MAGSASISSVKVSPKGVTRVDVTVTCSAGTLTRQLIGEFHGRLVGVLFQGATVQSTADVLLTDEVGGPILSDLSWGASSTFYRPSAIVTDNVGVAVAAATTAPNVNRDIYLSGRTYLEIANAQTTDTGIVSFIFVND